MAGYGTDNGFTTWAAENGHTVPTGNVPTARQRGSAYIDGIYGPLFSGAPTGGVEQERAWPRTGATAYGNPIANDAVPGAVIKASYEAALMELTTPGSLSVVTSESERIKRLKAGSVELEYATSSGSAVSGAAPMSTVIEGLLAPLLASSRPLPAILII